MGQGRLIRHKLTKTDGISNIRDTTNTEQSCQQCPHPWAQDRLIRTKEHINNINPHHHPGYNSD